MEENCMNCKHKKTAFLSTGAVPEASMVEVIPGGFVGCALGYNEAAAAWWRVNGPLPYAKDTERMLCYVPHEITVALDAMAAKAQRMLDMLNREGDFKVGAHGHKKPASGKTGGTEQAN